MRADHTYKRSMSKQAVLDLERRRDALLEELRHLPNFTRGAVYEKTRKCGRATCHCATGGERHLTRMFSVILKGRTYSRYVRLEEYEEVQRQTAAYQRLWEMVGELTEINLDLLQARRAVGVKRKTRLGKTW